MTEFDEAAWREELTSYRAEKDGAFADSRQSPIPPDEREAFSGLDYFDPNPEYRVDATVEVVESDDTVAMETTAGGEQLYERVARLRFELRGDEHALVAYQRVDRTEDGSLFVPFRDKTTGQQTYGAGRYMELHYEGELEDGATVPLDFNLAYNPFCAYNDSFACSLPPQENWLEAEIRAGERDGV